MKSKLVLSSLLLLMFIGCSKDDSNEEANQPPVLKEQLVESIFITSGVDGLAYNFTYNEDHRIKKITSSEGWIFNYTYQGELLVAIKISTGNQVKDFTFEYNAQNKLKSFTVDGQITPVGYNSVDNSYTYPNSFSGENYITTMFFNNSGDLLNITDLNTGTQAVNEISHGYDTSNKGSSHFTNNNFLQSYIVDASFYRLIYLGQFTHNPITVTSGDFNIIYQNNYDENTYISESKGILGNIPFTTSFNYITL